MHGRGLGYVPNLLSPQQLFQVQLYPIEEQAIIIQQLSVSLELIPVLLKFSSIHLPDFTIDFYTHTQNWIRLNLKYSVLN